jgi:hypothetical protein
MNTPSEQTGQLQVTVARGNIYVPLEVHETYFKGIVSVALLPHEEGVLLIPLIQQSAGGLLLKIKNLRGDRVIHAQEFWRQHGYPEKFSERGYPVRWNRERAALLLVGISTS